MLSSKKNLPLKGPCGRCLSEFIDWRYSQSCWYFLPSFVNYCLSNPSLWFNSFPLPCVNKYTVYTNTLYMWDVCGSGPGTRCLKSKEINFKLAEHDPYKAHFKVYVSAKNPSAV